MAERDEVIDVKVVVLFDDDVDHRVEDGALLHRRFGARRLDVVLDLLGDRVEAVHVEDLLADLVLVGLDVRVSIDLLGPEVFHDLDRPFAEDILLEDVREAGLRINREDQDALALASEPVGGCRREGGLAETALAAEHDVAALRVRGEHPL